MAETTYFPRRLILAGAMICGVLLVQALQARGWARTFDPWSGHPCCPLYGRVPCWTAFTTSSPMIVSASSTSSPKPQDCRISRVKWRAARADSAEAVSTQEVTAGVSHHADGTGRSRGELKPGSESAEPLTAKSVALSVAV